MPEQLLQMTCFYWALNMDFNSPVWLIKERNMDAQGRAYLLGLMDYRARFYSVYITHFTQPDTIIANPQSYNRYSYGLKK
jgi:hypothetical protein